MVFGKQQKVKTYEVKILDQIVWVNPHGKEEGTFVEPAKITSA